MGRGVKKSLRCLGDDYNPDRPPFPRSWGANDHIEDPGELDFVAEEEEKVVSALS